MLGSSRGQQVITGEQRVLGVLALQGSGRARTAGRTPGAGSAGGLPGLAVFEQLLVLAPPVLAEKGLARILPSPSAHGRPLQAGGKPEFPSAGLICTSYLN